MKVAEILRNLANIIDASYESPENTDQSPEPILTRVEVSKPEETDNTSPGVMMPPLQQKLELLKKTAGIENAFDDSDETQELPQEDELCRLKKIAGLHFSSEDTDHE